MHYAIDRFEQEVRDAIIATERIPATLVETAAPKPNIPADLAFPAFRAAKELGLSPQQLAQDLAAAMRFGPDSLVGGAVATGPFLNFTLHPGRLAAATLAEIAALGPRYGCDDRGAGQSIIVDYSSPNIAKRMHVGHIRSTIIGQSIVNILRFQGYHVIGDNHLGDWGKQFGVVIAAVMRYGKPQDEGETTLERFEEIYARYNEEMKASPELDAEARAWSLRLEQGDAQARELWQWMVNLTLQVNQRMYNRLGVHIDHAYGESFYESMLGEVIQQALDKRIASRDEGGAVVVDLGGDLPTFLLQRSDSGTLYMTRDVATIKFRLHAFKPTRIIYVLGIPQELHLRQLFALVRALGDAEGVELTHIKFGTVFDQYGQPLSTRKRNMVYLETLLNDAHIRARAIVEKTSPDLPDAEKDQIAELVGVGAVIYNDLYQDTRRNITLDWDRMLALDGNSATYIQYMYARCRSIIRKVLANDQTNERAAGIEGRWPEGWPAYDPALLTHPAEMSLIKQLAKLPLAVREASERYAPFVIAEWCYETARSLAAFYRDCQVLRAETPELQAARLHLVAATAQALKNGLGLLGIRTPERM